MSNSVFTDDLPRRKDHGELRKAVCKAVDSIPEGTEFSSLTLQHLTANYYARAGNCFLETILRYLRMYRRESVICISRSKSLYKKVIKEVTNE